MDGDGWRAAVDPYGSGAWLRRLAWGDLTPATATEAADDASAAWRIELSRVRAVLRAAAPLGEEPSDIPFAHLLRPIAEAGWDRVRDTPGSPALTPSARADLREALLLRLSEVSSRALGTFFSRDRTLTDVALARVADGNPPGSSSFSYRQFCNQQASDGLDGVLAEFPVLGRLLATVVLHWASATTELITRVAHDRDELHRRFGIPTLDRVVSVRTGLSDPHNGGRGVAVLVFESGRHLVYKPRSVEIESKFQDLLAVVVGDRLRRLDVLQRGAYGYVEYVEHAVTRDADELRAFYGNAGRLLAILFLLGATDCHWENLIAARDQLVLIDAETLFEGVVRPSTARTRTESMASDSMADSVLRTGMLPAWLSVGPARAIDISALGAPAPGGVRELRPGWCFVNTDDMVWGDREAEQPMPTCLPIPPGHPNPLSQHGEDLVAGFDEVLAALTQQELRERVRSVIDSFCGARRRIVVRPTRTYALVQTGALSSDALRAADRRALQLERLARAYLVDDDKPSSWPLLHHEIAGLEDLDIPYFEGAIGSPALYVRDEIAVDGYYEKEGLAESLKRLDGISQTACDWQCRLIRAAIAAHRFEMTSSRRNQPSRRGPPAAHGHDARDVAHLIKSAALDDPTGPPTWLTVALMADATRVQLGLVPPGLYDGRAGIAAFLHDCGDTEFAAAVLQPVLDALDEDANAVHRYLRDVGLGMSGIGGVLRLFCYRAEAHKAPNQWSARAERVVAALSDDLLNDDPASDLVSGIGGLAAPVAALHARFPSEATVRVLATLGTLLLERQSNAGGWSLAVGHPALAGLSHGASGVATALAHIAVAVGDQQCADAAARALRYEAELFDPVARNWPDLRNSQGPIDPLAMRSWCHGSVGVALSRVRVLELLDHHPDAPEWREQLEVAIEGSIAAPLTPVDHLCCGNLGRAVVIAMAGRSVSNTEWEEAGLRLAADIAERAGESPGNYRLLLGIDGSSGIRLPGMMTGLAGIGMHLVHGRDTRWAQSLLV